MCTFELVLGERQLCLRLPHLRGENLRRGRIAFGKRLAILACRLLLLRLPAREFQPDFLVIQFGKDLAFPDNIARSRAGTCDVTVERRNGGTLQLALDDRTRGHPELPVSKREKQQQ